MKKEKHALKVPSIADLGNLGETLQCIREVGRPRSASFTKVLDASVGEMTSMLPQVAASNTKMSALMIKNRSVVVESSKPKGHHKRHCYSTVPSSQSRQKR